MGVNDNAKWNNLFFVSLYDHLYQRGYVNSTTEAKEFMGGGIQQSMCGCVEEMKATVARSDCTEAIGLANYTMTQNQDTGLLQRQYKADITPEKYQSADNIHRLGLRHQSNDLSAHIFRQYLEGRTDTSFTDEYEKIVVGYKHPEVNRNDREREKVCQAKFEEKFPTKAWELVETEDDEADLAV